MEGYNVIGGHLRGCVYCRDGREICRVLSTEERIELVMINGMGHAWESVHDREITLCPGIRRAVCDVESGEDVAYVAYHMNGAFCLHCGQDSVWVQVEGSRYTFRRHDAVIAVIQDCVDRDRTIEAFDGTFCQTCSVLCDKAEDERMLLLMLAMPWLRFGM